MTESAPPLPRRCGLVDVAEFDEGFVVYDARTGQVHVLAPQSALVLDSCDGETAVGELVDEMVDAGAGTHDEIESLVSTIVESFEHLGLIEGTQPPKPPPCIGCGSDDTRVSPSSRSGMIAGPYGALDIAFTLRAPRRLSGVLERGYADLGPPSPEASTVMISLQRRVPRGWRAERPDVVENVADEAAALTHCLRSVDDLAALSASPSATVLRGAAVEIEGVAVAVLGSRRDVDAAVAAAVGAGHAYVAGGAVAIADGSVRPFHRPIKWRAETASLLGLDDEPEMRIADPWRVGVTGRVSAGAPVGAIAMLRPSTALEPKLVSPFDALSQLAGHATAAVGYERVMFRRLERLVRQVPIVAVPSAFDLIGSSLEGVVRGCW